MKIKIKMPPNHFAELVTVVGALPYSIMPISNLDIINLKYFYYDGVQRITRLNIEGLQKKYPLKDRMFNIDVNHYEALKKVLIECDKFVSPLTKSIFIGIKNKAEPEILRQVSQYKLIG